MTQQECTVRWLAKNPNAQNESSARWRAKNPNYMKDRHRLKRYGLTWKAYDEMLIRQQHRCLGCHEGLTQESVVVDHDHITNRIRGLLCRNCNWALGNVGDNRSRLYQLAAYLELDRSKPIIYLIGSLRNPKIVEVGNAIRSLEIECIDNWFATGEIADDAWRDYSKACGKSYKEALESREANHIFYFDKAYLNLCDAVVLLYPAGRSGHLELGYAMGLGKPGYILIEEEHLPERYDVMAQFATCGLFHEFDSLLGELATRYGAELQHIGNEANSSCG